MPGLTPRRSRATDLLHRPTTTAQGAGPGKSNATRQDALRSAGSLSVAEDGGGSGSLFEGLDELGVLDSMAELQKQICGLIWSSAPLPGDSARVHLKADLNVEFLYGAFELHAEVEHHVDGKWTLKGDYSLSVGVGEKSPEEDVHIGVQHKKGLELTGGSPKVCIDEIGLFVDQWLRLKQLKREDFANPLKWLEVARAVFGADVKKTIVLIAGGEIADLLFGRGFKGLVLSEMGEGDGVESEDDVGIEGKLEVKEGEHDKAGVSFGYGISDRTEMVKEGDELVVSEDTGAYVEIGFEVEQGGITVEAEGELYQSLKGGLPEIDATFRFGGEPKGDGGAALTGAWYLVKTTLNALAFQNGEDAHRDHMLEGLFAAQATDTLWLVGSMAGMEHEVGVEIHAAYEHGKGEAVLKSYDKFGVDEDVGEPGADVGLQADFQRLHEITRWPLSA
jgi:hypothetical protein